MNAGVALGLGSWGSMLLLVAVTFWVYRFRMIVEEKALIETIGEPYRRFLETRKRLIPFVY
jgi:protein-S-isoprenylcysteine O-methyltransferase Ste14